jgi:hypothetical protein
MALFSYQSDILLLFMLNAQCKTSQLSTAKMILHFVAINEVTADVKQVKPEISMNFIILKLKVKITLPTDFPPPFFLKVLWCLEGSQTSPLFPTGKSIT